MQKRKPVRLGERLLIAAKEVSAKRPHQARSKKMSQRILKKDISQGHLRQQLEALLDQLGLIEGDEAIETVKFGTYAFNPNDHYYDEELIPVEFKIKKAKEVQTIIINGKERP